MTIIQKSQRNGTYFTKEVFSPVPKFSYIKTASMKLLLPQLFKKHITKNCLLPTDIIALLCYFKIPQKGSCLDPTLLIYPFSLKESNTR